MAIERLNKTFIDGEVWDSTDINPITTKIDECIDQINLNTDEIETARGGEANLNDRINNAENSAWAAANAAQQSADNAAQSEENAQQSANAAAQSENNANTYKEDAYGWANTDEDVEFTDSQSRSGYSAYHYSKKAEQFANSASSSADNAAQSENNSQTYRDEAYKWANEDEDTQVTDSAGHSGYSAYHYSKKAEASANAAAQSESNASTSESNAAQSESEALAHLNEFKGIYYGSYAEDPETDPNGDPPDAGDYYWNTTRNVHRVYNGSGWEDALSSANNVSYDNTNSGLSAINVQDAVDEVESRVKKIEDGTTIVPNADKLDGEEGSYYTNASNLNAGTVPVARLSGTYNIDITGNADKVDNFDASQTPQANQIPVLNSSGQLWLPFAQTPILVNGQDMMSRTFYVDAENGDDNNDGSESAPFKTIKKACDSVPIGGYGTINLVGGQELLISSNIIIHNKMIDIIGDSSNFATIVFKTYVTSNINVSCHIGICKGTLRINYCILQNEPKIDTNFGWDIGGGAYAPLAVAYDSYGHGHLILSNCNINQTRDYFIASKHSLGIVTVSGCDIDFSGDANSLINTGCGTLSLNVFSGTITSGYKWATGTIGQNVITNLPSLDT